MNHLYPMSYSKDRRMAKVRAKIVQYPEQKMNTTEAFNGLTLEWHIPHLSACGSLSEYKNMAHEFILHCDDGTLRVEMGDDEKWYVVYENPII